MGHGRARAVPELGRGVLQGRGLLHSCFRRERAQVIRDSSSLAPRLSQTGTTIKLFLTEKGILVILC